MASIVCLLIQLYMLVIFARIILSWVVRNPPTPGTAYAQIVGGSRHDRPSRCWPRSEHAAPGAHGRRWASTCRRSWSSWCGIVLLAARSC